MWEAAKKIGVEGPLPDEVYVELIEDGEKRDQDARDKRRTNTDAP